MLCMYALPAEGTCFYRQMTKSPNSFFYLHSSDHYTPAFVVAHGDGLDSVPGAAAVGVEFFASAALIEQAPEDAVADVDALIEGLPVDGQQGADAGAPRVDDPEKRRDIHRHAVDEVVCFSLFEVKFWNMISIGCHWRPVSHSSPRGN